MPLKFENIEVQGAIQPAAVAVGETAAPTAAEAAGEATAPSHTQTTAEAAALPATALPPPPTLGHTNAADSGEISRSILVEEAAEEFTDLVTASALAGTAGQAAVEQAAAPVSAPVEGTDATEAAAPIIVQRATEATAASSTAESTAEVTDQKVGIFFIPSICKD